MTGSRFMQFWLRVCWVFFFFFPASRPLSEGLLFCLHAGRLSFQLDPEHKPLGKWGVCFGNELEIELQLINIDHTMLLQLISSFYKAWFSTKHNTSPKWIKKKKKKRLSGFKAEMAQHVVSLNLPACSCHWFRQSQEALRLGLCIQAEVDLRPVKPKPKSSSLGFRRWYNPDWQIPQETRRWGLLT